MTTKQIFARLILAALLISNAIVYSILLGFEGIVFIIFIHWAAKNI